MGNEMSNGDRIEDVALEMRMIARALGRERKRSETRARLHRERLRGAIVDRGAIVEASGSTAIAAAKVRIEAEAAVRAQETALQQQRLAARLEAVAARIWDARKRQKCVGAAERLTVGLETQLRTMPLERVAELMGRFEEQMDDLELSEQRVGDVAALAAGGDLLASPERVEALIEEVGTQHRLDVSEALAAVRMPAAGTAPGEDPAMLARLAAMRRQAAAEAAL